MTDYFKHYLEENRLIGERVDKDCIDLALEMLRFLRKRKGRLFILGNGGSAANASHAVNDFRKIAGIEAYAPSDNVAELTAWANDTTFALTYTRWLSESRLNDNDLLLVLSVGGGSPTVSLNLEEAMGYARERACSILSIVGRDGGAAKAWSTVCILIPTVNENTITPHVEDWQLLMIHYLTKELGHTI